MRKEQSAEVLDLRMACLQERLGGVRALTDVFSEATGEVVENAVSAANALASLDRCADVPVLRAVVRPPEDARREGKVEDLRKRVAQMKAKFDAGRRRRLCRMRQALVAEARKIGYEPLVAETLLLVGHVMSNGDWHWRGGDDRGVLAAEASRHDEVRAEARRYPGLRRWLPARSVRRGANGGPRWRTPSCRRLGGHELLQAWLLNDLGWVLHVRKGHERPRCRCSKRSCHLKEKSPRAAIIRTSVSRRQTLRSPCQVGRNEDALAHIDASSRILEEGLGADHPDLAMQLSNGGEILNALNRYPEARRVIREGLRGSGNGIWIPTT